LPALKRLFVREAAGLVGEVPKLLRGESLANPQVMGTLDT